MAESVIRLKRQLRYQGTILKIYEDTVLAMRLIGTLSIMTGQQPYFL